MHGIIFGFKIPYKGPARRVTFNNHHSTAIFNDELIVKLDKEIDKGRIAGPFQECPFNIFHSSPFGIIPKKEPNQVRLIHYLSYGDELSVKYHIDKDTRVSYELLDKVVDIVVKCGRSALVSKGDIEHAFRILPINPDSYHLLGFNWQNQWCHDKSLPMGLSTSCQICELFLAVSEHLDIPIKHSKTVLPTLATVHDIEIDTVQMKARLPQEKLSFNISIKTSIPKTCLSRSITASIVLVIFQSRS